MKKFSIGRNVFTSLEEAVAFYSVILNRVPLGQPLKGHDADDVSALFGVHPNYMDKLNGHLVDFFFVDNKPTKYQKGRCFYVMLSNGEANNFSIRKSVCNAARKQTKK